MAGQWSLHHDNTPSHTAHSVKSFVIKQQDTVLEHTHYSLIWLHVTFSIFETKLI
jgi:hypothetical protein